MHANIFSPWTAPSSTVEFRPPELKPFHAIVKKTLTLKDHIRDAAISGTP
jgi:hypothetical protein